MSEPGEGKEPPKGPSDKWLDVTRKTFHSATFKAGQYKRIVQKKIDLGALHKKISMAYADLGKVIDDSRGAGEGDILATDQVQQLLQRLDSLKQAAETLEQEIEAIKTESTTEGEHEETH